MKSAGCPHAGEVTYGNIGTADRLDPAQRRPVSLEDFISLPQVANDVHHAHAASDQERGERGLRRVPGHLPAHKVAIAGALFIRALAEHGEGDVARMNIGQLADLRCNPGAPLATAPAQDGRCAT